MSHELVTLKDDVEVETPIDDFAVTSPDPAQLVGFLKALEFTTLTRRIASGPRSRRLGHRARRGYVQGLAT